MMMARIEKFETENRRFEAKYHQSFHEFKEKMGKSLNQEVFEKEEDYLDWRFAKEAMDRLEKQKLELEHA